MVSVASICGVLRELAPLELAESWDNVGLLLGDESSEITRLMTCLTLTESVAEEAVNSGAGLVVTHHPLFFRPVKRVTMADGEGRTVLRLLRAGIAVYSAHTAWDSAATGINQQLAELLGLGGIRVLREPPGGSGLAGGGGRYGQLQAPLGVLEFGRRVARLLGIAGIQIVSGCGDVQRVAVACGAAAEYMRDAQRAGCDTLITGEARFHAALEAESLGMNLLVVGHYASERRGMEQMAAQLCQRLVGVECFASGRERDPLVLEIAEGGVQ